MKFLSTIALITISLCAGLCCPPEEDGDYESFEVQKDHLITIENDQNVYQLDDTIYINTLVNNNQVSVDEKNIFVTDFTDLDNDPYINYNIVLYKETNFGTLAKIEVTNDNIIVTEGLVQNVYDEIIEVKSSYNGTNFKSRFGIKLLETGTYYLASPNFDYTQAIYIQASFSYDKYLTIISKIKDSDEKGAFKFIVE